MNNSKEDARITGAWIFAWRMRCCPPDTAPTGELTSELKRHLEICPFCRSEREAPLPEIQLDFFADHPAEKRLPRVGELWSVANNLGGWGPKQRYYSPPVVLVTALADQRAVNVVQTFGDNFLAGPDDLLLDNDIMGFAEPWNRYTLDIKDLGNCLGTVSAAFITRLQETFAQETVAPTPGSLLWFFRQMEVETGWFFAEQSIAGLLEAKEAVSAPTLLYISVDTLLSDLKSLPVTIFDAPRCDRPEDILANTMPADDLLPLAAADVEPRTISILLFTAEQGRIRSVKAVTGHVTLQYEQDSLLLVSGLCEACPGRDCEWMFRWKSRGASLEPLPGQYGVEDGVFWAVFSTDGLHDPDQGELIVRIIDHQ